MALTRFGDGTGGTSGPGIASSPVNDNFAGNTTKEVYKGSGFNVGSNTSSTLDQAEYEMTAITAANLGSADYLILHIHVTGRAVKGGAANAYCRLGIQTKEVGGSYSDSLALDYVYYDDESPDEYTKTITWAHTLTAGEKSNGVQVKIKAEAWIGSGASGSVARLDNKCVILSTSG